MLSADRKFQEAENMRKSLEADRAKYLKVRNLTPGNNYLKERDFSF
jgi:hypothetical protein